MFKKLRLQMILIELLAFVIFTVIIVGAINIIFVVQVNQNAHVVLQMLSENNGKFPKLSSSEAMPSTNDEQPQKTYDYSLGFGQKFTEESQYITRYFLVTLSSDFDTVISFDLDHIAASSQNEIYSYLEQALISGREEGSADQYRYLKVKNSNGTTTIYFVDCTTQLSYINYIMQISVGISFICLLIASVFVWLFSKKAINPLKENMEKQKRFITDASHELKTPIAAIQANADVLELVVGENETIDKIKRQTKHLTSLVNELLSLARTDTVSLDKSQFELTNLSSLCKETLKEFESRALSKNIEYDFNIKDNIKIKAAPQDISRLISVLTDNAMKYCKDDGKVVAVLTNTLHYAKFDISNTSDSISQNDLTHLFDRFYRIDSSRSKDTGGYGIGLSIAKAITDNHKGRIYAKNDKDCVHFVVELPLR